MFVSNQRCYNQGTPVDEAVLHKRFQNSNRSKIPEHTRKMSFVLTLRKCSANFWHRYSRVHNTIVRTSLRSDRTQEDDTAGPQAVLGPGMTHTESFMWGKSPVPPLSGSNVLCICL